MRYKKPHDHAHLSLEKKQELINQVRHSKTFAKATTSNSLLQYLFNATIKGTDLKEGIIDIEFFGATNKTDKNNPRVRVNVYNLRKKLISYYEDEGAHNKWQIIIEKGQYKLSFLKKPSNKKITDDLNLKKSAPYIIILILISILILILLPPQKPTIWKSFLSKKKITNLFIGDLFGVIGITPTGGEGWCRDFSINNIEDFYALCDKKPALKKELHPANYASCTGMAALSTQQLQSLYQTYHQTFSIRFSTQTSISVIKEGNAIYVGPIKNNNPFISFFNDGNPYLHISNIEVRLSNHPTLKDRVLDINTIGDSFEYAIVSKYPGPNDTDHFVFFSQHDYGVSATVEYFTSRETCTAFSKKYLHANKRFFTAVFLVKGKDRTNTHLELKMVVDF
jgi:hypothetical protein